MFTEIASADAIGSPAEMVRSVKLECVAPSATVCLMTAEAYREETT